MSSSELNVNGISGNCCCSIDFLDFIVIRFGLQNGQKRRIDSIRNLTSFVFYWTPVVVVSYNFSWTANVKVCVHVWRLSSPKTGNNLFVKAENASLSSLYYIYSWFFGLACKRMYFWGLNFPISGLQRIYSVARTIYFSLCTVFMHESHDFRLTYTLIQLCCTSQLHKYSPFQYFWFRNYRELDEENAFSVHGHGRKMHRQVGIAL